MIETLRTFATSWIAKILLVLLVASFAVWGVQIAAFGTYSVAEVGDEDISVREFSRAYARQLEAINERRRISGGAMPLTPQEAAQSGVPIPVVAGLVRESALGQEALRVGVDAPDDEVRSRIAEDTSFHGANGFDGALYDQLLRREGFRRTDYEEGLRRRMAIAILSTPFVLGVEAPREAGLALWRREQETRTVGYFELTPAQIAQPEDPGDATLTAHHAAEAARFTTPERRKLDILIVDPAELADPASVDEAEARRAYAAAGARYNTPERRNLQRLDFDDLSAAQAAATRARGGVGLADIAAERAAAVGGAAEDVDLGYVTRDQLEGFTPAIAEAAFADGADGVLDPIAIDGRYAVVRIAGVLPGRSIPFETVRDDIARAISAEGSENETARIAISIDDARAGGAGFEELAEEKGVRFIQVEIDRAGRDPDGRLVSDLPADPRFLSDAFEQAVGEETDLQAAGGGVYWTSVTTELSPATLRPFEEARDDVLADWRRVEREKALAERAEEAVRRIEAGETVIAVAASLGVEPQTAADVRRGGGGGLPAAARQAVFALPASQAVGAARIAEVMGAEGPRRLVLTTLSIETPDPTEAETAIETRRGGASVELARDLLLLYETAVEARYTPEIDFSAVEQVATQSHRGY